MDIYKNKSPKKQTLIQKHNSSIHIIVNYHSYQKKTLHKKDYI